MIKFKNPKFVQFSKLLIDLHVAMTVHGNESKEAEDIFWNDFTDVEIKSLNELSEFLYDV